MLQWLSKLKLAWRRRRGLEEDLSEEMRAHLDFLTEEHLAQGMSRQEAESSARRAFGNRTSTLERATEAWQFPRTETFLQDIRYSLRGMRKAPAFSLVLIITLALAIGANTAIFSVVYSVLLRPLPYPTPERLVWLGEATPKASGISVTWVNFLNWRSANHTFDGMAGFRRFNLTLTGREQALLTQAASVSSSFFSLVGWQPVLGRLFQEDDERTGAVPTVVITHEFWTTTLGADRNVLESMLTLNGKPYQVIGILPPGSLSFLGRVDYFLPLGLSTSRSVKRSEHGTTRVLGLLKPNVTVAEGRADLDSIMQRLAAEDPGPEDDHRVFARSLMEDITGDHRQSLFLLMGAVGLVLIIACANVASLLLARGTARAGEIAIRTAIGAGRGRLIRQMLTESMVTSAVGGLLGVGFAALCLRVLIVFGPRNIPRLAEATLDIPVLLFAAGLILAVGLVAGIAPVLSSGKVELTLALKEGSAGAGSGKRGNSFRSALVIAEIAITLVLAFASGLLLRSLMEAQKANPGFDPNRLLALELQIPTSRYKSDEHAFQFYSDLMRDLRSEPGVEAVGAANCAPSSGGCGDWWYSVTGRPAPDRNDVPISLFNGADTEYFRTMRLRIVAGRSFTASDRAGGTRVAVINEELAGKWWAAPQQALGNQIKVGGPYQEGPLYEIIGVLSNASQMGLDTKPLPEIYMAFSQRPSQSMTVMIRTSGEPASFIPSVRRRLAALDRNVPIQAIGSFQRSLAATLERRRFSTFLLAVFASLAMMLATVGIYGVLNYWVSVRRKEIAIRTAMGAPRLAIALWAGTHATRLAVAGIVLGACGAWAAERWLKNMVFGVAVEDPATMVAAGMIVITVAALAASVPLWAATRVDTVRNLHDA